MRNFSAILQSAFVTYDVNSGEYTRLPTDVFPDVCTAIASALEVERMIVWRVLDQISKGQDPERVTPSEGEVLQELFAFYKQVCNLSSKIDFSRPGPAFVYHNLNTGRSVIWVHVTC